MSVLLSILIGCSRGLLIPGPIDHMHVPSTMDSPESVDGDDIDPLTAALSDPLDAALSRTREAPPPQAVQDLVVQSARSMLDQRSITLDGQPVRHDCSGMVAAAYQMSGLDISSSIDTLYDHAQTTGRAHTRKIPESGDLVFFDNSYDKNDNGVRDDPLTHIAIVEQVDENGTITMIHLGGKGKAVARTMMNLYHPDDRKDAAGQTINSALRSRHGRDGGPTLTAQLFRGFGSLWQEEPVEDR